MTEHPHAHTHACGCHEAVPYHHAGEARSLVEHALVLSKNWSGLDGNPAVVAERVRSNLHDLARCLSEDGIIFGHLKAFLCCGRSTLSFSVTRLDTVDETPSSHWPPVSPVDWMLTVNVLSLIHTEAVTKETLDALFG